MVQAKSFWQHCGEVISSRLAVHVLSYLQSDLLQGAVDFSLWSPPAAGSELASLTAFCGKLITLQTDALGEQTLLYPVNSDAPLSSSPHTSSTSKPHASAARAEIIARIGSIVEETPRFFSQESSDLASNIALTPSGMSAIYTALRLALLSHQQLVPADATSDSVSAKPPIVVVFGFPYLDTLKVNKHQIFHVTVVRHCREWYVPNTVVTMSGICIAHVCR